MQSATLNTSNELLYLPDDGMRRELVKGEMIVTPPASGGHGLTTMRLAIELGMHVKSRGLGILLAAETGFILARDPDTVRAPDIAYISNQTLARSPLPSAGFVPFAPDLAVEVLSPGDSQMEVDEKIEDWLAAGAKAVWIVNPRLRMVTVHRRHADPHILREEDTLTADDVVEGFSMAVADIFVRTP